MKDKLEKYRAEREKNTQKIAQLKARNSELDALILEQENLNIVAQVRAVQLTPEQLAAMIREFRTSGEAPIFDKEDDAHED